MITILLVLFILDGDARTFAVKTDSPEACIAMQIDMPNILPNLIGKEPQFYAAACAPLKPIATDI